jgi:hypothetical protein
MVWFARRKSARNGESGLASVNSSPRAIPRGMARAFKALEGYFCSEHEEFQKPRSISEQFRRRDL